MRWPRRRREPAPLPLEQPAPPTYTALTFHQVPGAHPTVVGAFTEAIPEGVLLVVLDVPAVVGTRQVFMLTPAEARLLYDEGRLRGWRPPPTDPGKPTRWGPGA